MSNIAGLELTLFRDAGSCRIPFNYRRIVGNRAGYLAPMSALTFYRQLGVAEYLVVSRNTKARHSASLMYPVAHVTSIVGSVRGSVLT